jgi:hypothetical protein
VDEDAQCGHGDARREPGAPRDHASSPASR